MISWASSKLVILGVRQRLALHKLLSRTKGSLTRYRSRRFSRLVESAFARLQFTKPRLSNVATCSAAWPASHATVACNLSRLAREIYWGQRVQSSPVFLPSLPGTRIEHTSRAFRSRLFVREDACTRKNRRAPIRASINSSSPTIRRNSRGNSSKRSSTYSFFEKFSLLKFLPNVIFLLLVANGARR